MRPAAESQTIDIAGAGPAGLSAAIVLARHGRAVRVFERRARVGSRFHDDLQGIENWSLQEDCLAELRRLGIEANWWHRAFDRCELRDDRLRQAMVRGPRHLFYMVRRGPAWEGSLDNALLRQARQLGVEIRFGQPARPDQVHIFAAGPRGRPMAVVRGLTFPTERPDLACTLLAERLAPGGYAYALVAAGQATLATVQIWDFGGMKGRLLEAAAVFERIHRLKVPAGAVPWGGFACFSIPTSAMRDGACVAGEAAGFQDALFGFGIRSAMVSGALAAQAVLAGRDYDRAWRARVLPQLQASQVNRLLYDRVGLVKPIFFRAMQRVPDGAALLRRLYSHTLWHRPLGPLAGLHLRRMRGSPHTGGSITVGDLHRTEDDDRRADPSMIAGTAPGD